MKSTHKLFRGKRRGKRLVFVYTLSGRTLKVITDFAGEIILQLGVNLRLGVNNSNISFPHHFVAFS